MRLFKTVLPRILAAFLLSCCALASSIKSQPDSETNNHLSLPGPRPYKDVGDSVVKRYYVPSTDEIYAMIQRADVIGDRPAVFWTTFPNSGVPVRQQGYMTARDWATQKFGARCNFVLYNQALADEDFARIFSANRHDEPNEEENLLRVRHTSKAFARSVKGTVWLLVMDGKMPRPESTWSVWEFPVITRRGKVDQVIMVEYPSGRETVFWDRSQGVRGSPPPPGKI